MMFDFIVKLVKRVIKLIFSYVSWQTHEKIINPVTSVALQLCLLLLLTSLFL